MTAKALAIALGVLAVTIGNIAWAWYGLHLTQRHHARRPRRNRTRPPRRRSHRRMLHPNNTHKGVVPMGSKIWCDRSPYLVKENRQEVLWLIRDVQQDRDSNGFIHIELTNEVQVVLSIAHISSIEPA